MLFNKLRISSDASSRLRSLRQRTGLTPNLLCRVGLMLSLDQGSLGDTTAPDEEGQEFNAYTLTGDHEGLIVSLLRIVEDETGQLDDAALTARLRAHIHRGVANLSVRAKSPIDLVDLLARAA